eukprot:6174012-Pleurochrysis_carterae.AAC.4
MGTAAVTATGKGSIYTEGREECSSLALSRGWHDGTAHASLRHLGTSQTFETRPRSIHAGFYSALSPCRRTQPAGVLDTAWTKSIHHRSAVHYALVSHCEIPKPSLVPELKNSA